MSAHEAAKAALSKAHSTHDAARVASESAAADAAELRARVKSGQGAKITAAQIAEADQKAEHAALALHGATVDLPTLSAAVQAARADEACEEVLTELPQLGRDVAVALDAVEAALAPVVTACRRYDEFVESATHRLQTVAPSAAETYVAGDGLPPRGTTTASPFVGAEVPAAEVPAAPLVTPQHTFTFGRHSQPAVDGVPLASCRGPGQLAAVLLPAMRELGAHSALIEALQLLASGAPTLPTP